MPVPVASWCEYEDSGFARPWRGRRALGDSLFEMLAACLTGGAPFRPASCAPILRMSISEGIQSQLEGIRAAAQDAAKIQWPPLSADEAELQTTLLESQAVEDSQAAIAAAARQIFDPANIDLQAVQVTSNGLRRFITESASKAEDLQAAQSASASAAAAMGAGGGGSDDLLLTAGVGATACLLAYTQRATIAKALDDQARKAVQALYPPGTFDEPTSDSSVDGDGSAKVERSFRADKSFWQIARRTQAAEGLNE